MITIYQKTIIEAEMYESVEIEADKEVLDEWIDDYTDHIVKILKKAGHKTEVRYNDCDARCYHTDTDEEYEDIRDLPSFWEWYN